MIEDEIRKILLPAIVDKKRRDLVFARIIALCKKDKEEAGNPEIIVWNGEDWQSPKTAT